ncbi:Penicillin binding protein (plasmid) [Ketogulonicigenium robustum]|uniref:Penicillin binding protein n=1 Tax=Ketogulonicigenium robustum TaxID=92947 RepID=A0A1W6P3I0_9RHOB|nr:Penicillin binding protein [Ketogulonicigenium robustum]
MQMNWDAAAAAVRAAADWADDAPGGAVVLFDTDGVRASAAAGVESLATRVPFGVESVVRYASVTKHVFASFVLAEADVIGLDDPLGAHLPALAPLTAAVTVRQALGMTGGLPDTREALTLLGLSVFTQSFAPDLLAFHTALPGLNYPAGTEVHYSNGGYRLVEEALRGHGRLFDDYLRDHLRGPHGLGFKAAEMWTDPVRGLCPGYWHDGRGWQVGLQGMHLSAAGSLTGSARDLAAWGGLLLRGEGEFAGRLAALSATGHLRDGRATGYGLGMRHHMVGGRDLVGHGGSQPGFKSYILLDPLAGAGCIVVANRDDVNSTALAERVMAALYGAALPVAENAMTPGLYVAPTGADWIEVNAQAVTRLDDTIAVYPDGAGGVDSRAPTSPLHLRMEGEDVVGTAGHAPARFQPARPEAVPATLDGLWRADPFGAMLEIYRGAVVMGAGPTRRAMPLQSLGGGRYLFTLHDGPWVRRVCLNEMGGDRFQLALSRARSVEYRRISGS